MKIERVQVFAYSLPLREPMMTARGVMDRREGWLISVTADSGETGWGDVCPLPGFSVETPVAARDDLRRAARSLPGLSIDPVSPWAAALPGDPLCASVRFGIESALADCAARSRGLPMAALWDAGATSIPVNALAAGSADAIGRQVEDAKRNGFKTVKVKVGRRGPTDDAEMCRRLRVHADEGMRFRFDANRAWSVAQAREFVAGLEGLPFEYLEEPLGDPRGLAELAEGAGIPVALDESILEGRLAEMATLPNVRALVLKPVLLGGIAPILKVARDAMARGLQVVMSSSFESGVGLRVVAELAAVCPAAAAGLDTVRWLAADVVKPRISVGGGAMDLLAARAATVNVSRLVPDS